MNNTWFTDKPEQRRTGRSTAIAMRCIAEAMYNGTADIKDHDGREGPDRHLADMIGTYITRLGLIGFTIRRMPGPHWVLRYSNWALKISQNVPKG